MNQNNRSYSSSCNFYSFAVLLVIACIGCQTKQYNLCQQITDQKNHGNIDKIKDLVDKLGSIRNEPCVIQLAPLYSWAQNMSHIIVKFEFVNSAETSACDQILSIKKIIDYETFSLVLICLQSTFVIRYSISVRTFMPINYHHAVWKNASQNSIILQCMKSPNPFFWKNLYVKKQVPSKKPKIWWSIMEKYRENMKDFYYDLQVEEGEDNISGYVRGRKQIRIPKESAHLNPFSQTYFYCNQNNPFELGSWLS